MPDLPNRSQLALLATLVGTPRARLTVELASAGYDSDQISQARSAGPHDLLLPERETTTQAISELASLTSPRNAQGVREAGIRALAGHNGEPLGNGWEQPPVQPGSSAEPAEDSTDAD